MKTDLTDHQNDSPPTCLAMARLFSLVSLLFAAYVQPKAHVLKQLGHDAPGWRHRAHILAEPGVG
jgi:hypothetical protein